AAKATYGRDGAVNVRQSRVYASEHARRHVAREGDEVSRVLHLTQKRRVNSASARRRVNSRAHRRRLADGQRVLVEHTERKLAHVRLQQTENFYAVVDGYDVESLPRVSLLCELAARRRARISDERVGAERAARYGDDVRDLRRARRQAHEARADGQRVEVARVNARARLEPLYVSAQLREPRRVGRERARRGLRQQ